MQHGLYLRPNSQLKKRGTHICGVNEFWPRFVRVALLCIVFGSFTFFAVFNSLFAKALAAPPARGAAAAHFDWYASRCLAIAVTILSFYVVDAIQLTGNFIRVFTQGLTKWPVSRRCQRLPPLSESELSRYHDVLFVADRTEQVARLIWYPLLVLAIVFVAQWSFFDNWTWYPTLVLFFVLNATWAIGSAAFLRRTAEQLRQTALDNLQHARLSQYASEEKRQIFDELIAQIRGLKKGAFAPLSEQPFIRAIVVPSGALGLLAVGQRLLESFWRLRYIITRT